MKWLNPQGVFNAEERAWWKGFIMKRACCAPEHTLPVSLAQDIPLRDELLQQRERFFLSLRRRDYMFNSVL